MDIDREKRVRITFTGDVMCEQPLLEASRGRSGYDFCDLFADTAKIFRSSSYTVVNLETPIAGADAGYTSALYSFNTPASFLDAVKAAGIGHCVTANNHCLDRGIDGLRRTIAELDCRGLEHTGTYADSESASRIFIKELGGIRIAILSYTYGTGIKDNHIVLSKEDSYACRLLMPQQIGSPIRYTGGGGNTSPLKKSISALVPERTKLTIKKKLGKSVGKPRPDSIWDEIRDTDEVVAFCREIAEAKKLVDTVIVNVHNGGQFNPEPGPFSEYIMKCAADAGADLIVGNHPHVVQRFERIGAVPCAYSLGNFSISPSTPYVLHGELPELSIALHLYIDEKKACSLGFSILKIVEDSRHKLRVYNTSDLYRILTSQSEKTALLDEVCFIYKRFTGNDPALSSPEEEYSIGDNT